MVTSNGSSAISEDAVSSLDKIKRQLALGSGKNLLQGPLLKRSETLRIWNERWVILDPTTGKMEYKMRRSDVVIKGSIMFDSTSTITLSPLNFHGLPKYEGCCFYIGTPQKKEYFICAETPGAARAWVSTLHASQLVLRAHKEAVNSLSGNSSTQMGTVATVLAAANSAAFEATKEIEAAMRISMRATLATMTKKSKDVVMMNDLEVMKKTLQVKDEELQHLSKELRVRDSTIKEIADKLIDTAEAAESAANAARVMDEERTSAWAEIKELTKDSEKQLATLMNKLKESEEKVISLNNEKELLLKQTDHALQEAHFWRSELGKAREHAVILEASVVRADERSRMSQVNAEAKFKDCVEKELAAAKENEELLNYVKILQSQIQSQVSNTKQVINETSESCADADRVLSSTRHVDLSDDDVDKACLSDSRNMLDSGSHGGGDIRSIGDSEWGDLQSTDVREISTEHVNDVDIPVVSTESESGQQNGGSSLQP